MTYFVSEKVRRLPLDRKIAEDLEHDVFGALEQVLGRITSRTMVVWGDKDELIDISCGQCRAQPQLS